MSEAVPPSLHALLAEREWVRALARRLVGDAHEAEDVAQEALAIAWERSPRDLARPRGWLAEVLRNVVRQRRRRPSAALARAALDPAAASAGDAPSTAEVVERAEAHGLVVREVLDLDEPYRTTVLLRYFEGLTPR